VQFHEIGLIMMILGLIIGYVQRLIQLQFRFQALSLKLFAISETERQYLSRELHDGISQRLAALRLRMQMLALKNPDIDIEVCSNDLLETMEEMGRILHGLRPLSLEKFGLIQAMQHEVERVAESSQIAIFLNVDEVEISLKKEQHLFRIFQ
jgi:signal transduction histidine kinase